MPDNYFNKDITKDNIEQLGDDLLDRLENTCTDSARSTLASWIGLIYQITNADRKK